MKRILLIAALLAACVTARAAEIWVSPTGDDRSDGSRACPKATLRAAIRDARNLRRTGRVEAGETVTIRMEGGIYRLYEPIRLRFEDSGTAENPLIITSAEGARATLSGGLRITGWRRLSGPAPGLPKGVRSKVWVADVPRFNGCPVDFRQLWIDGVKAVRARDVADFEEMTRILRNDKEAGVLWVPARAVRGLQGVEGVELVLHQMWAVANLRIRSIEIRGDEAGIRFHNPEQQLQFEHPWPSPMTAEGVESPFYLTNAIQLLDTPGEWYHDAEAHKLYYYPREGEEMTRVEATVPVLENLVVVEGTLERPAVHIRFENIGFEHAAWMRPSRMGHVPLQAGMYLIEAYKLRPKGVPGNIMHGLENQAWTGRPAAGVVVRNARDIRFEGCRFERMASCGLDFAEGVKEGGVNGSIFRDLGGNGIQIGTCSPEALENHLPYDPADKRVVCEGQQITNNLITEVTNEDWGCTAVCAGFVAGIRIAHNEISEISYTGISLGWGWTRALSCMHDNRVEANHIHHYAKHMYDTACIYTLSAQPRTTITRNAVHSIYSPSYVHDPHHWFYLYTDEGSSYIEVVDNWCEGEKFLRNANGPGVTFERNGPDTDPSIRAEAGLELAYRHLLNE